MIESIEEIPRLEQGIFVYIPPVSVPGVFGGIRKGDSWARSTPISWMKAGPPWVKSGGSIWRPHEELFDFGGELSPRLAIELAKINARIIMGSVEEGRWRIAVPKENLENAMSLLREAREVDYIKHVEIRR